MGDIGDADSPTASAMIATGTHSYYGEHGYGQRGFSHDPGIPQAGSANPYQPVFNDLPTHFNPHSPTFTASRVFLRLNRQS